MAIKFLTNTPALFISGKDVGRMLVIADLHIGLEHELFKSGIVIASQVDKFKNELSKLIDTTMAESLVILGDIKHKVPGVSFRELKEIPKLMDFLIDRIKVAIVKGNHDDFIENIVPKEVEVHGSQGFKIGNYGFFHGHAWPAKELMQCDHLFMAHVHPGIEFSDCFGFRIVEPVWVKAELDKKIVKKKYKLEDTGRLSTIIVPTFNPILGGIALNRKEKREYIGPLLSSKAFNVSNATAYMFDGTELNRIKNLKTC
jgi:putative SbcD/Mre11-related phosphoesterase